MKFKVLRQHLGDKMYMPGDEREADEHEVRHLVDRGVLVPRKAKADAPVGNKAEKGAPKNKAE
ncbi:hypothetical protein I6F15_11765 [Bradyrhizobium sp. BRP14]|nr:hypothetical protein [Bradyrhizobium sp. BRP14]